METLSDPKYKLRDSLVEGGHLVWGWETARMGFLVLCDGKDKEVEIRPRVDGVWDE